MNKLRVPVYLTAGYNTISLGSGRKEFHPKKPRPGIEHYIQEAGDGVIAQINDPANVDEGVIGNFMAQRFNRQGNLPGFIPMIHDSLRYKPATGTEGACCSGGLALFTSMKSILAEISDVVLCLGVEVQNTVKAIYGADILGGAGHYASQRKEGHAYFFPSKFSDRAEAYMKKVGDDNARRGMAQWYVNAIENARKNPKAQEYHNTNPDLFATGMTPPNPKVFCDSINVFDCSKVSDGGTGLIFASEDGLRKIGVDKSKAVKIYGWGQAQNDVTEEPMDRTKLDTTEAAAKQAYEMAGLGPKDIGVLEVHDCFTITGLLMMEALGFAEEGQGRKFVLDGKTKADGEIPTNTTGGLIGYGHPTGASGVRETVDVLHQLTGQAGDCQVEIDPGRPYGLMISMGGNDRTVHALILGPA
jgi:acetyl-CoA C-acetyltransferase/acetyl-CoA acyltransferase